MLIESSQLAAKFDNSLEDKLEREERRFDKAVKKSNNKPFSCHDDAARMCDKLVKTLKLHHAHVDVQEGASQSGGDVDPGRCCRSSGLVTTVDEGLGSL